ncbi:CD63 antigen-like isoform X2 [Cylas formicarius]|uniref:CD63 antigen-like isoform X2 n=1 Tax=Cylas formicarius TaxID=197179 RepID=UPI002958D117|nr:CD63 antigen-like isoform X2 [Cylas formicarius]
MASGVGLMKLVLFVFNIFLTLSGIGIIIAGAFILTTMADFNRIAESDLVKLAIALIFAGAIVTIVAFIGCLGAMRESYVILMTFAGLLLAVFIMELTVGICAAAFKADYKVAFKESLTESMKRAQGNGRDKNYWDVIQRQFKCCGVDGPRDWPNANRPISCCLDKFCAGDYAVYHQIGCYDQLVEKIQESTSVLAYVGVGIAFMEIIGIFLTCWLANSIKSD